MIDIKVVATPGTRQELNEVKSVVQMLLISNRVRELAKLA